LANYDGREVHANGEKGEFRQQTTDVDQFHANAWGLYDMHGNVWEWCANLWHSSYDGAPRNERPWIEPKYDKNESETRFQLLRGGSWYARPRDCRSAFRDWSHPDDRYRVIGFRVCCLPQDLILYP
jgi:formylglycine-generating enzyme required for sulfatase activity